MEILAKERIGNEFMLSLEEAVLQEESPSVELHFSSGTFLFPCYDIYMRIRLHISYFSYKQE